MSRQKTLHRQGPQNGEGRHEYLERLDQLMDREDRTLWPPRATDTAKTADILATRRAWLLAEQELVRRADKLDPSRDLSLKVITILAVCKTADPFWFAMYERRLAHLFSYYESLTAHDYSDEHAARCQRLAEIRLAAGVDVYPAGRFEDDQNNDGDGGERHCQTDKEGNQANGE